ncbi:PAS domain-containing sensor histidine kinase [Ectothiorhodospiraceae bacterium BW-2]|nr:PAS domain-containing sensor histidine kinase [Ectothiorhodospiraceae bacterium BW-2]
MEDSPITTTATNRIERLLTEPYRLFQALGVAGAGLFSLDIVSGDYHCDDNCRRLLGVEAKQSLNYSLWRELIVELDREEVIHAFERQLELQEEQFDFQYRIHHPRGERWISMFGTFYRNAIGEAICYEGVLQDVTSQRMAEEALKRHQKRFRTLVDSSPDIIWECDEQLHISYITPRIHSLTGYSVNEVMGRPFYELATVAEQQALKVVLQTYSAELATITGLTNHLQSKRDNLVVVQTNAVPIFDSNGAFGGFYGVSREISDRLELNRMRYEKDLALGNSEIKALFMLNTSHELRNTMHAIISFSSLGQRRAESAPPQKLRRYFDNINQSSVRLLQFINDIHELAELEGAQAQINLTPLQVDRLIEQEWNRLLPQMAQQGGGVSLVMADNLPLMQGDEGRLQQLLQLLLTRVVRQHLATVRLTVERGDGVLLMSLAYPSEPLSDEQLSHLFDLNRFGTQTDNIDLDLPICRAIVQRHRGKIWAENCREGEVVLRVQLPFHQTL